MLQALPFTTPGNSQGPTPERHWQHTLVNFFLLIFLLFVSARVEAVLNWSLVRTFQFPLDGCWVGGNFFFFFSEWLLIVLDHYNLCNFQRLYDYKEKRQTIDNTEPF